MRFITLLAILIISAAALAGPATAPSSSPSLQIGTIRDDAIPESSGIAASRKYPGVFWTHNDSGNAPVLYAINREGKTINAFAVSASNRDWEDICIDDEGHLYIGEIGNNLGRHNQRVPGGRARSF